jgi:hypothetical protein
MLNIRRQVFTKYLSSFAFLLISFCSVQAKEISLGFVLLQTVSVDKSDSSKLSPGIVVRFFNKSTKSEMFAITNDVGFAQVPLRPGTYCYDAYSSTGHQFQMKRPESERCFDVRAGKDVEVGVEFSK